MPRLITKVFHANEFWVFLVIAALSLVIQARSGQFFTANNLVDLAGAMVVPGPVSYTHLDVYKRQIPNRACRSWSLYGDSSPPC